MFWFVFALYLANGHSDWSNGPQQRLLCWGPEGPQHSSPSKRKMLPWCPLVAKNCGRTSNFTADFCWFSPYIWPTVGPTVPSKGCFAGGPKGPQHSSPSKRKMLPWRPLVAKNCHQVVLYSMFWFVFALYLANGHSDWSNGPQQRLLCWGPEGPPA